MNLRNFYHKKMKKMYKIGDNIKIIWMAGEPEYTGRVGTIDHIDDIGQLHGTCIKYHKLIDIWDCRKKTIGNYYKLKNY